MEARAINGLLVDPQLMPQGQMFQAQGYPQPKEAHNQGQQSRDDREHDEKPPHHDTTEDGGVRCISMRRNSKKVKWMKSFRFSGQTGGHRFSQRRMLVC
jgi:hypothetical protein